MEKSESPEVQGHPQEQPQKLTLYADCGGAYDPPPQVPSMQTGIEGITFDFNYGLRVRCEPNMPKNYVIEMTDHNNQIFFRDEVKCKNNPEGVLLQHDKKYFFRYNLRIFNVEDQNTPIFEHAFNLKNQKVAITLLTEALGDNLCWFPYYEKFRKENECDLYVTIKDDYRVILEKQYPEIHFITQEEFKNLHPYATYYPGLFFSDFTHEFQPVDFRMVGLHKTCAYILGVDPEPEIKPLFDLSASRTIKEKYVCIATQSTGFLKLWSRPDGWNTVCKYLKTLGYRVLCVDRDRVMDYGYAPIYKPEEAEDFTGRQYTLQDRINLIKDAEFFVGLSSGLSWLAWGCNVPVVLISGFTQPANEFYTPYRVFNRNSCNSCWNDARFQFSHDDPFDCPVYNSKPSRKFECMKSLHPNDVIDIIKKIPCVKEKLKELSIE